jgi:hypothetical protein
VRIPPPQGAARQGAGPPRSGPLQKGASSSGGHLLIFLLFRGVANGGVSLSEKLANLCLELTEPKSDCTAAAGVGVDALSSFFQIIVVQAGNEMEQIIEQEEPPGQLPFWCQ